MSLLPNRRHWVALAGAAITAVVVAALVPSAGGAARAAAGTVDPSLYAALKWRNIGPNTGGRVLAVAGSAARPNEYYFGATGGGLWKTTDGGTNWAPVTDQKITSSSVGAIAVCPSNPD